MHNILFALNVVTEVFLSFSFFYAWGMGSTFGDKIVHRFYPEMYPYYYEYLDLDELSDRELSNLRKKIIKELERS